MKPLPTPIDDDGVSQHIVTFGMLALVCMVIAAGVLIAALFGVIP